MRRFRPNAAVYLTAYARRLERRGDPADAMVIDCIRRIVAQRSRLLTEKYGPPRDFSRPPPTPTGTEQ